jgi:hypothetical protein
LAIAREARQRRLALLKGRLRGAPIAPQFGRLRIELQGLGDQPFRGFELASAVAFGRSAAQSLKPAWCIAHGATAKLSGGSPL